MVSDVGVHGWSCTGGCAQVGVHGWAAASSLPLPVGISSWLRVFSISHAQ